MGTELTTELSRMICLAEADGLVQILFVVFFVAAWGFNAVRAMKKKGQQQSNAGEQPQGTPPTMDEMLLEARRRAALRRAAMEDQSRRQQGQSPQQARQQITGQVPASLNMMLPNPMPMQTMPAQGYKPPSRPIQKYPPQVPVFSANRATPTMRQPTKKTPPQVRPAERATNRPFAPEQLQSEVAVASSGSSGSAGRSAGSTTLISKQAVAPGGLPVGFLEKLRNPTRVREAFVLGEILQQPVGMRDPLNREF